MRSIILDGTDVTDHVFQPGRVLHGWGAKESDSFIAHTPSPTFHAAVARVYRLADEDARKRYWPLLRDLFKGAGLGDLGTAPGVKPAFNFATQSPEPGYIFALSGLFAHHPDHLHTFRHQQEDEGTSRRTHGRSDPAPRLRLRTAQGRRPGRDRPARGSRLPHRPTREDSAVAKRRPMGLRRPLVTSSIRTSSAGSTTPRWKPTTKSGGGNSRRRAT